MRTGMIICLAGFALMMGCTSVPSNEDLSAVADFDASRYMGVWHEVARLPQWFQRGMTDVTATYSLEGDMLRIVNEGTRDGIRKTAEAKGYFAGEPTVGLFRVTFFWPFYSDYKILWISPEYDLALVTSEDRNSLWILARSLPVDRACLQKLRDRAESMGFDISRLEWSSGTGD